MFLRELEDALKETQCYDFDIEDPEIDLALDVVFLAARLYLKELKKEAGEK